MREKILLLASSGWICGIAAGQTMFPVAGGAVLVWVAVALSASLLLRRAGFCLVIACAAGLVVGRAAVPLEDALLTRLARDVARCAVIGELGARAGSLGILASLSAASCEVGSFRGQLGKVILDGAPGEPGSPFRATGRFVPFGSDGFSAGRRRTGALVEFDATEMDVGDPAGLDLFAAAVRTSARRSVEGLGPRTGALSLGLVIGDTSGFDAETEGSFRRAGLSHLVAVSGSNVAIVLGAVLILGSRLSVPLRLSLAGAALGIFVLVVGPEPSVLRAAAMGSVALLALLLGRRSEPLQALSLATMVLSALRPSLVFSLGFWLSVAATLGIILWASAASRSLERIIGAGRKRAWLGAAFGVTCAAQLAVAPILALVFGTLSVAGPLANLLAVPAVPPATILGFLAAVTGTIAPPLAGLFASLSAPFLGWILWVADRLGQAGWSDTAVSPHVGWALSAVVAVAAITTLSVRRA